MKRPRIIPILLLQKGGLVKSIRFDKHIYIGDPINAVRIFNNFNVDEIILLDIDASIENRTISIELIKEIGEEANMPFSVGGGIKDIITIQNIIKTGAEKVILNTSVIDNFSFIKQASETFGSSTISVCIDYKKNIWGKKYVCTKGGLKNTKFTPLEVAIMSETNGAGEVILQNIDKDGTMTGFDTDTIIEINNKLTIPVVALGGAGQQSDFEDLYSKTFINAIAAGSFFVFKGKHRGVLIQYPAISTYKFRI